MPTTEKALLSGLLRFFLTSITEEKITEIWKRRVEARRTSKLSKDDEMLSENLIHGEGCLDEKDYMTMKKVVDEHRAKNRQANADAENARPSMVCVTTESRGDTIPLDEARAFAPEGTSMLGQVHRFPLALKWRSLT